MSQFQAVLNLSEAVSRRGSIMILSVHRRRRRQVPFSPFQIIELIHVAAVEALKEGKYLDHDAMHAGWH